MGSCLVPMLLEQGYLVKAAGKSFTAETLALSFRYPSLQIIQADLTEGNILDSLMGDIDGVIHLAGLVGEKQCLENPELAKKINVDLVRQVNVARQNLPLIFLSSTSVYGSRENVICDETTKPTPELAYAKSKYEGEQVLEGANNVIILRAATFFGYAPAINFKVLVNDFVLQAVKNKKLEIYDDTLNRTFVHIADLSRAIIFMLENFSQYKNQIFNVGNNSLNCSKRDLAEIIKSLINFELIVKPALPNTDKRNFVVNYDKIEKAGLRTQISLKEGIKELITKIT